MGAHRSGLGLYYSGLASSGAPLPLPLQHRIARYAESVKSTEIVVSLLARKDLDPELLEAFGKNRAAAVRVAWLQRHADQPEVFLQAVAGEKRKTVLATLAAQPELPDDAFGVIVAQANGLDLALTVLETKRLGADEAEKVIAGVADSNQFTQYPFRKRIDDLSERYPGLWPAVAMATENVDVAAVAAGEISEPSDELVERILTRFVETPLVESGDRYYLLEHCDRILGVLDHKDALSTAAHARVAAAAKAVIATYGRPKKDAKSYDSRRSQLQRVLDIAESDVTKLPDTVSALAARTPESADQALSDVSSFVAKDPNRGWYSPTVAGIAMMIIGDDAYGLKARNRAMDIAVNKTRLPNSQILKAHAENGFTIDAHMVRTMWSRLSPPQRRNVVELSEDPSATLNLLVDSERYSVANILNDLEVAGLLTDELLERTLRRTTAEQLFDRTWHNKQMQRRAISHVTDRLIVELGDSEAAWEFFEACFNNVDTGVVELAEMASGTT